MLVINFVKVACSPNLISTKKNIKYCTTSILPTSTTSFSLSSAPLYKPFYPDNATTVKPVDSNGVGLYDPTWNETTNSWNSLTEEEWKKKYTVPEVKPEPTQDQQTLAALTKQVMQLQVANMQQQKVNASLIKQLIDLNKGGH